MFISNFTLTLLLVVFVFSVSAKILLSERTAIIRREKVIFANYYQFLLTILKENITKKTPAFLIYFFVLLTFLLIANLLGMVPYTFALTSHFAITLFLSFITFFTAVMLGFQHHGKHFFDLFLPAGAPFVLAPFLIVIELISFTARLFSLAIRLFANIMSGHTLLKILAGFSWVLFLKFSFLAFVPFIVVLVVTGLEIVIAFLQAYVFSVLSAIYFNEALLLH